VLGVVVGWFRLIGPEGGTLDAVVDAQGAAVGAIPGTLAAFALAHGALVEGMPVCGCEDDVC
jgi:hypothetical protein